MIYINVLKNFKYLCIIYHDMLIRDRVLHIVGEYLYKHAIKYNVKSELKICRDKNYKILMRTKNNRQVDFKRNTEKCNPVNIINNLGT